jgi:hypothetical protein
MSQRGRRVAQDEGIASGQRAEGAKFAQGEIGDRHSQNLCLPRPEARSRRKMATDRRAGYPARLVKIPLR